MIPAGWEPKGLHRDTPGLADPRSDKMRAEDARSGSRQLLQALLRAEARR